MANTNKNRKVYICATAQVPGLIQSDYEGFTWVEIQHVGNVGESGSKDNIVNYDELATDVLQKNKGITNAGDPMIECARNPTDAGQIIMRAAGKTVLFYALKIQDDDAQVGFNPTTYYNLGLVVGPVRPNGRNEAFNLEQFTMGCVQREIVVDPVAQSVPVNTFVPHISSSTGDIHTNAVLTVGEGSWSNGPILSYVYQWQQDTAGNDTYVNISAATAKTYTIVAGNATNKIRCEVKAVNGAGTAASFATTLMTRPCINP